ncbi:MAG: SPFH domain-containing protein [Rikenellaceae bacterium]|nr:SPFH domain-containing protein [Rikenellaceae bacterium]
MENKNFEYKGWKINGFVALFLLLALMAGSIAMIVLNIIGFENDTMQTGWLMVGGIVLLILSLFSLGGFILLEPNEARVLTFFGKYCGSFYDTGFWWVNFLMSAKKISLRARNLNAEPIKVNDKTGNPIMIGMVLVWRLKRDELYRSVFDIDVTANEVGTVSQSARMNMLENFVAVQSDAALRQVAGCYAYDNNSAGDDEITLRSSSDEINELLESRLADRLAIAGIEVVEARINYLAYAPEIAAVMLRRQQADAIISAREKIVEGAVSMVKMALERLDDEGVVELDDERKAAMVTNMLVVLCADESAQPVVNAGTMYH